VVERLRKNVGRYCGETIDVPSLLRRIDEAVVGKNWVRDPDFFAFIRKPDRARVHVYISAGIHGDEPAGPLAVLRLIEDDIWPFDVQISLCPCLNPKGLALNTRENADGVDLNRDFRHLKTAEVRAHVAWLQRQPNFDLTLCLHEDWESNGFYVYEVNPDNRPSFAQTILDAAATQCPVDMSPTIENWPATNGILRPGLKPEDRPNWPEALYLIATKTRQSYTLEAPSDFPLPARVSAHVAAVRAVLAAV
jgi:murein peptide amidase A